VAATLSGLMQRVMTPQVIAALPADHARPLLWSRQLQRRSGVLTLFAECCIQCNSAPLDPRQGRVPDPVRLIRWVRTQGRYWPRRGPQVVVPAGSDRPPVCVPQQLPVWRACRSRPCSTGRSECPVPVVDIKVHDINGPGAEPQAAPCDMGLGHALNAARRPPAPSGPHPFRIRLYHMKFAEVTSVTWLCIASPSHYGKDPSTKSGRSGGSRW
jgi:hypothetical protein